MKSIVVAAGPVSRILSADLATCRTVIPLGDALLRRSSDLPGTSIRRSGAPKGWRAEPARAGIAPGLVPYLVLLRVGFALPRRSLDGRCALTAPFHPYLGLAAEAVCFLWHFPSSGFEPAVPDVIRHTALRSSDFPPHHRAAWQNQRSRLRATIRSACQPSHYIR